MGTRATKPSSALEAVAREKDSPATSSQPVQQFLSFLPNARAQPEVQLPHTPFVAPATLLHLWLQPGGVEDLVPCCRSAWQDLTAGLGSLLLEMDTTIHPSVGPPDSSWGRRWLRAPTKWWQGPCPASGCSSSVSGDAVGHAEAVPWEGRERVLGEGASAAVSLTQQGTAQDNRCLCSKNSWRRGCFPRRNPNLQRARGRQQHVGCQRSRTGTFWKAEQTCRQIGSVAAGGPNEQVVKLHVLLKDTPGLGAGRARLPGPPSSAEPNHSLTPGQPRPPRPGPTTATSVCPTPLPDVPQGELLELLLVFLEPSALPACLGSSFRVCPASRGTQVLSLTPFLQTKPELQVEVAQQISQNLRRACNLLQRNRRSSVVLGSEGCNSAPARCPLPWPSW